MWVVGCGTVHALVLQRETVSYSVCINLQYALRLDRRELNVCVTYLLRAGAAVAFYWPVSALRITAVLLPLFLNESNFTNTTNASTATSALNAGNKQRERQPLGVHLWAENPGAWAETRSEYALQLLGAGLLAHVLVVPVHCINFLLCCARVRGFSRNVRRLLTLKPLEDAS